SKDGKKLSVAIRLDNKGRDLTVNEISSIHGKDAILELKRYSIRTSAQPAGIALKAYRNEISKDRGVAQIEIRLLDENGVPAILADNLLACRIEGPGKLLGMEAGDNTDMGNYRDNRQRVFMGRMIAYAEASREGDIKVSFSSPWIKTETITIQAK
ncbi:MAG: hypothetical protein LBF89_05370, partial [Bacteroidales bacterium]|nr:hypothetical protein [Bacteroidales bacterium]